MTKTEQEKVERLELALRHIAYLRPAGPSRNKTVEDMERIALEALSSIAVAFHSPDPSADGGGGGEARELVYYPDAYHYDWTDEQRSAFDQGVRAASRPALASRTPAPGAVRVAYTPGVGPVGWNDPGPGTEPYDPAWSLDKVCEPWRFSVGDPPDWDIPLHQVFAAGMIYSERLLAAFLDVKSYEAGDGSEDFDNDATMSLQNILTAAKLYDPEEGKFASLAAVRGASA